MRAGGRQFVDILIDDGLVTTEQLSIAFEVHELEGRPLGAVLVDQGLITEPQLVKALAEQIGLGFVDFGEAQVDATAVAKLSAPLCNRYQVLAFGYEGNKLKVAMADPGNVIALDDIRQATRMEIQPVVAAREDLSTAINRYCRSDDELDELSGALTEAASDRSDDLSSMTAVTEDAPIVKYVNLLITQAISDRASDIHIEPAEHHLRVRYRIDGVLHEVMTSPKAIAGGVTSRLKIMADIDIAERRVPQDGRLSLTHNGRKIDLRVATLPTVWGEKVVMRILDNSTAQLALSDLGFSDQNFERFESSYVKPYGMILVTGPTGSGKSTTLYATLNIVSNPQINVITVEDPVEYRLPGINQVQVNVKAGLTFASALRSILRSDPDVVLIGEIRDHETAQIAVEAALTGHLVLSTLHTNDAPSAITRLTEMGIEPFLVGSALDSVLAQRLARRLCAKCKQGYEPSDEELIGAQFPWRPGEPKPRIWRPVGCTSCGKTGYKGRLALQEIMLVNEEIERLAVSHASSAEINRVAIGDGMTTLRQDGWLKVLQGSTSIEEVLRVVA